MNDSGITLNLVKLFSARSWLVPVILLAVMGCSSKLSSAEAQTHETTTERSHSESPSQTMLSAKEGTSGTMITADRLPPEDVKPIDVDDIRYEVIHWGKNQGLDQNGGYIKATHHSTGEQLWILKIYHTEIDPEMEMDVQEVFITSMKKVWFKDQLKITDERNRTYRVDLNTREVTTEP